MAMALVKAMTAPFDAEYAVRPRGRRADIEDILTILPPPVFFISGIMCFDVRNIAVTLTFIRLSHRSWSSSTTDPA